MVFIIRMSKQFRGNLYLGNLIFMKQLLVTILTVFLFIFSVSAQSQTMIKPATNYRQDGITFALPNQPKWKLLKADKTENFFEKSSDNEILNASVKTIKTKTFEAEIDLLASFEDLKNDELSKMKKDSIHYNYTKFKGSPCVQYDGIFNSQNDTFFSKFEYFNFKGYLCSHPKTKGQAIQIKFSNYSNVRGFPESLNALSNVFFEKITFSKSK